MLDFGSEFNNDDPFANTEMFNGSLNTPQGAILLVLGNLAGLAPFVYNVAIGSYTLGWVTIASLVVSFFYHLCQTSQECFLYVLFDWISNDHFTATWFLATTVLSFINVRTRREYIKSERLIKSVRHYDTCGEEEEEEEEHNQDCVLVLTPSQKKLQKEHSHRVHKVEENMLYDHWSVASFIVITVITHLAVRAHPFSYEAFVIVFTSCMLAAFIKIMLIEEGEPTNFKGRFSLPELVISFVLNVIGLVAYVLDSYVEYLVLHSVWHVAIYLGTMFFEAGTKKSVNGWIPLWRPTKRFFITLKKKKLPN